jgi:hypothetical protein
MKVHSSHEAYSIGINVTLTIKLLLAQLNKKSVEMSAVLINQILLSNV